MPTSHIIRFPISLHFEINLLAFQLSGGGVEHPLQIAVHPQDVAVGEEHVHRGDAQDLAHEEAPLRPKVSVCTCNAPSLRL